MPTTETPTTTEKELITETITVTTPSPQLGEELKPYLPYYRHHPMKRQIELGTMFEDETILLAIQQENACNPVLRASANSILETYVYQHVYSECPY